MSSPPPAARLHNNTVLGSRSAMTELAEESVRFVTCSQKLMRLIQFGSELISALLMASPRLCKRARQSKLSFCSWVFSSSPGFQEGGRPDPGEAAGVRQGELPPTVQTPTPTPPTPLPAPQMSSSVAGRHRRGPILFLCCPSSWLLDAEAAPRGCRQDQS